MRNHSRNPNLFLLCYFAFKFFSFFLVLVEEKLTKITWSDSLAPGFVGNDCATAEIAYSIALARHELVARSRAALCCLHVTPPRKRYYYCCVKAVSLASVMRGVNIACLLLWLLCQLGKEASLPVPTNSIEFSPSFPAFTLSISGSANNVNNRINWHHEQDRQYSFQQKNNDFHVWFSLCFILTDVAVLHSLRVDIFS